MSKQQTLAFWRWQHGRKEPSSRTGAGARVQALGRLRSGRRRRLRDSVSVQPAVEISSITLKGTALSGTGGWERSVGECLEEWDRGLVSFRKDGCADGETPDKTGPSVCKPQVESHGRALAGGLPRSLWVGPGLHVSLGKPGPCTQGLMPAQAALSAPLRPWALKTQLGFLF